METFVFNTILVHVSRTWERVRLTQPHQEMPFDNIQSVDEIVQIADLIVQDKVIQKFIKGVENGLNWDWKTECGVDCSDSYIEQLATDCIDAIK